MAVQFPDPNVTQTYTNPDTGEVYKWNATSGGWRRVQDSSGGSLPDPNNPDPQPGTLDDRYVNLSGDTMTGALVQHPGANTAPGGTGNLATNTPSDTRLEFRYQGSDDTVRCVTLPLGCCQTVTQRTHIQIQGGGSGFAQVGDVLEITENATIDPSSAIEATQWQRETGAGTFVFEDIAGETGQTYTVDAADLGLLIRVRESFLVGQECEKVVPSNVIAISDVAPVTNYIGVTFDSDTLKMQMELTADAEVYREDNGNWVLDTTLTAGSGVRYETSTPGLYVVESDNMTALRFSYTSGDTELRSIGLTLDERSFMDAITHAAGLFAYHTDFNQDLSWWNTANVTGMGEMFYGCEIFNGDITNWDTSNATSMKYMFYNAGAFNQDIGNWNTSNVSNMAYMFRGGQAFNQDIGAKQVTVNGNTYTAWNISNVRNMASMLAEAAVFNQDIGAWDTSNATNMHSVFNNAGAFNHDIGGWNTSNVGDMAYMFYTATVFNQYIGSWNTSKVTTMMSMFSKAERFNQDISTKQVTVNGNTYTAWDTSNVITIESMLYRTYAFNQNIGNWDISNVKVMDSLFYGASVFNQDIGNWDTTNVTRMRQVFRNAKAFNRDISGWDTSNAQDMYRMFNDASSFNQDISTWCVPRIQSVPSSFSTGAAAAWKDDLSRQPQWGTCPPKILTNPVIQ